MKHIIKLLWALVCCIPALSFGYEQQGTTIKKDGCNLVITIQLGIETDTVEDIAMIQKALDECFSITCDLPCPDRTVGKCKIVSKVIVMNWKDIRGSDQTKFHHIEILPGSGTSYVDKLGTPNGNSVTGKWYRHEYSPRVYCHEVLHLCGLPDRYRECRDPWRKFNDNCKDGDTCKANEMGKTPSCPGFEHDCMGTDVNMPMTCEGNVMAFVRIANDVTFVCDEEKCCNKNDDTTRTSMNPNTNFGIIVDAGLANYKQQNEIVKDDKLNLWGPNIALGAYVDLALMQYLWMMTYVKFNLNMVSGKKTETQGLTSYEDHYGYRFMDISLGINMRYLLMQRLALFAGPEVAFILMAKYKQYGTTTYNNMTSSYGENSFHNITQSRNIQFGVNLGIMYQWMLMQHILNPYFNIYIPFTNMVAFSSLKNKMYNINLGVAIPLR